MASTEPPTPQPGQHCLPPAKGVLLRQRRERGECVRQQLLVATSLKAHERQREGLFAVGVPVRPPPVRPVHLFVGECHVGLHRPAVTVGTDLAHKHVHRLPGLTVAVQEALNGGLDGWAMPTRGQQGHEVVAEASFLDRLAERDAVKHQVEERDDLVNVLRADNGAMSAGVRR